MTWSLAAPTQPHTPRTVHTRSLASPHPGTLCTHSCLNHPEPTHPSSSDSPSNSSGTSTARGISPPRTPAPLPHLHTATPRSRLRMQTVSFHAPRHAITPLTPRTSVVMLLLRLLLPLPPPLPPSPCRSSSSSPLHATLPRAGLPSPCSSRPRPLRGSGSTRGGQRRARCAALRGTPGRTFPRPEERPDISVFLSLCVCPEPGLQETQCDGSTGGSQPPGQSPRPPGRDTRVGETKRPEALGARVQHTRPRIPRAENSRAPAAAQARSRGGAGTPPGGRPRKGHQDPRVEARAGPMKPSFCSYLDQLRVHSRG